jgi:hypothetical protein
MTYAKANGYAAIVVLPLMLVDMLSRIPTIFHDFPLIRLIRFPIYPGWKMALVVMGGAQGRGLEHKLLQPALAAIFNIFIYGAAILFISWACEGMRRRSSSR